MHCIEVSLSYRIRCLGLVLSCSHLLLVTSDYGDGVVLEGAQQLESREAGMETLCEATVYTEDSNVVE
jgi:hypothetical protein